MKTAAEIPPHPLATRFSKRLVRRIRAAGRKLPLPDDRYAIERLRPGHWQRSAGAWSWCLSVMAWHNVSRNGGPYIWEADHTTMELGSQWSATECVASGDKLVLCDDGALEPNLAGEGTGTV